MADIKRVDKTRKALLVTLGVMLLRLPVGWGIQLLLPNPEGDPALFYARLIIQEMLLWDVNNGIARRSWARNEGAIHAIRREMERTPGLKVTLPNIADEEMIKNIL